MQDLLDLELAVRAQVGPAAPRARDDPPRLLREQRARLRASGVDPEDVAHKCDYPELEDFQIQF
jgi:hypothetical protein